MKLGVLIMAAGASRRFGGCKLLASVDDKPLLQYVIDHALALEGAEIVVVTGCWHDELTTAQQRGRLSDVRLMFNPDWKEGLGCSIRTGVEQLVDRCDHIMILLGDQILISTDDLNQMIAIIAGHQIACAKYAGKRGVPALFHGSCFDQLMSLKGDQGAKALLNHDDFKVVEVKLPDAVTDIDDKEDLKRVRVYIGTEST